jgi:hypothetical protein
MPELMAMKIYQEAADQLFSEPPLPIEELLDDAMVRYRVGKIITESVTGPEYPHDDDVVS